MRENKIKCLKGKRFHTSKFHFGKTAGLLPPFCLKTKQWATVLFTSSVSRFGVLCLSCDKTENIWKSKWKCVWFSERPLQCNVIGEHVLFKNKLLKPETATERTFPTRLNSKGKSAWKICPQSALLSASWKSWAVLCFGNLCILNRLTNRRSHVQPPHKDKTLTGLKVDTISTSIAAAPLTLPTDDKLSMFQITEPLTLPATFRQPTHQPSELLTLPATFRQSTHQPSEPALA